MKKPTKKPMNNRMNNRIFSPFAILLVFVFIIAIHNGCKKNEDVEHVLSISVADGVEGTPETGTYLHEIGDVITYEYTLREKYQNLRVFLDGEEIATSGSFTISTSHALSVLADPEPGDWLLSVATSEGVAGTPERGNYYYDDGQTLDYSYSLEEGYTNMRVTLNGDEVEASGTILFDRAHTLYVFADKYFEIRGQWTVSERYDDGSFFTVTLTFTGDDGASGIVTDSDGGVGVFETKGPAVAFTIEYPDVTYEYTGQFSAENTMSGNSVRVAGGEEYSGSWTAALDSTTSTSTSQGKNK